MITFLFFVMVFLAILIGAYLYRVLQGPTIFDRVVGLNGISTKAIILLIVIGAYFDRIEMYIDISTGYALLNLVGALAVAKYLEQKDFHDMDILAIIFIVAGLFFLTVAAIGVIRLPDVFSRCHAVSLTDSLGAFLMLVGIAFHEGLDKNSMKIIVVLALLYILNPVIAHATVRAALRCGIKPWQKESS